VFVAVIKTVTSLFGILRYNAQMEQYPTTDIPLEVRCYLDYFDFTEPAVVQGYFHDLHEASLLGDVSSQVLHQHFLNAFALYPEDSKTDTTNPRELYKVFAYSDYYNDRLMAMEFLPHLWLHDDSPGVLRMLEHNLVQPTVTEHDKILHEAAEATAHFVKAVRPWKPGRENEVTSLVMRRVLQELPEAS
jgi:hypothetical protein